MLKLVPALFLLSDVLVSVKHLSIFKRTGSKQTNAVGSEDFPENPTVAVVTFNMDGQTLSIPVLRNLVRGLTTLPDNSEIIPDIIVFGAQELMRLKADGLALHLGKLMIGVGDPLDTLQRYLEFTLRHSVGEYTLVELEQQYGMGLLVFVRFGYRHLVVDKKKIRVETGLKGIPGLKGGIAIRFTIGSKKFCFVNVHLDSDDGKQQARAASLKKVLDKVQLGSEADEIMVVLGDFNLRLNLGISEEEKEKIQQLIKSITPNGPSAQLMAYDEGENKGITENAVSNPATIPNNSWKRSDALRFFLDNFEESPIAFNPTFRFVPYTNVYSDKRVPAWCDRVFFSKNKSVRSLKYEAAHDVQVSDHFPVLAILKISQTEKK